MGANLKEVLLILRSQLGDSNAFIELIQLYHGKLLFFIRHMGISKTDCEDVLQEVWLIVFRKIRYLKNVESFSVWLYKITRNRIRYYFRKTRQNIGLVDIENLDNLAGKPNISFYEDDVSVIYKAIDKLSPIHRCVVILYFLENMPYKKIAEVIGCNEGTVKSRLHYAKVKLKQEMENA